MASVTSGSNYSVDNQLSFIVQWFRTWSELQKDDFVNVLAHKLAAGNNVNGLVNGMNHLNVGCKRVSLFACQVKLFNEWWDTWADTDKETLTSRLRESDPKFWVAVQEEISGTRRRLEDDFFLSINANSCNNNAVALTVNDDAIDAIPAAAKVTITTNGDRDEVIEKGDNPECDPNAE